MKVFRQATIDDKIKILKVFNQAKAYIKTFNIDQWQNGYPDESSIDKDIYNNILYVSVDNNEISGVVALDFNPEPTYLNIYEGNWKNDMPYAVIHRMAVGDNFRGKNTAQFLFDNCEEICCKKSIKNIRIDTHQGNLAMQGFLKKNDFDYCGKIYIVTTGETLRYAYQKILD